MTDDKKARLQELEHEYREKKMSYGKNPTNDQELELEILSMDIISLRGSIKYQTPEPMRRKTNLVYLTPQRNNSLERPVESSTEPHTASEYHALLKAVKARTSNQQKLVEEYYIDGLNMTEIAAKHKLSPSTVSRTLTRARHYMQNKGEYLRLAMIANGNETLNGVYIFDMRTQSTDNMMRSVLTSEQYELFAEYITGLNMTEIAAKHKLSPSTVSRTLTRARHNLINVIPNADLCIIIGPTNIKISIQKERADENTNTCLPDGRYAGDGRT